MRQFTQEDVGTEFKRLMDKSPDGLLRQEDIVNAAENPANVLHDFFEWNDTEAAHMWRLEQARYLIRHYQIYIPELKVSVRALTSLDMDRSAGGGFRWTLNALAKPDQREEILRTALRELESARTRYAHLEELAEIWAAIDAKNNQTKLVGRKA